MTTRKQFELSDCPKFAYPSLTEMNVPATAANIVHRLGGKGFLNYGQLWPRMPDVIAGLVDEFYLQRQICAYPDEWKNENLREVLRLLAKHFGGRGTWYRAGMRPFEVLPGAYFKPGAARDVVGIRRGAISGNMNVSFQAARSIG